MATRPPVVAPPTATPKRPFDVDQVVARIQQAVQPFPKAALFELHEEGHTSVFEQLCACIVSIRTRDARQTTQRVAGAYRSDDPVIQAHYGVGRQMLASAFVGR